MKILQKIKYQYLIAQVILTYLLIQIARILWQLYMNA